MREGERDGKGIESARNADPHPSRSYAARFRALVAAYNTLKDPAARALYDASLLGGAGAVESIFCLLALRDQVAPPTLNLDDPSDACIGVDLVPHVAKPRRIRAVLNNSFGFGGTNATLVMRGV